MTAHRNGSLSGSIVEFDAAVGLGVVESGDDRYAFHCIEIADGTRDIAVGTAVTFELIGKFGRYEAADIRS
ncbi:hypothetical protein [Ilumatobacter nonamiensis]|uniref:hypothetical protein n=1 Tax=Ilumatobacter nonamiensis TaxID=467093 RepID=UPI00034C967B|nr:hypothetical protein [Ilumatobacter nonamiensis]